MRLLSATNVRPVSEWRGTPVASHHTNGQKMGKKESGFHSCGLLFLRSEGRKGCRSEGVSSFAQHSLASLMSFVEEVRFETGNSRKHLGACVVKQHNQFTGAERKLSLHIHTTLVARATLPLSATH